MEFKNNYIYEILRGKDYEEKNFVLIETFDIDDPAFNAVATFLTGDLKGVKVSYNKYVSSKYIREIGHKDEYPEYFI